MVLVRLLPRFDYESGARASVPIRITAVEEKVSRWTNKGSVLSFSIVSLLEAAFSSPSLNDSFATLVGYALEHNDLGRFYTGFSEYHYRLRR